MPQSAQLLKTSAPNEIKLKRQSNQSKAHEQRLECQETEDSRISLSGALSSAEKKRQKISKLKFNTECSLSSIDKENSPDCSPHITIPSGRETSPLKIVIYPQRQSTQETDGQISSNSQALGCNGVPQFSPSPRYSKLQERLPPQDSLSLRVKLSEKKDYSQKSEFPSRSGPPSFFKSPPPQQRLLQLPQAEGLEGSEEKKLKTSASSSSRPHLSKLNKSLSSLAIRPPSIQNKFTRSVLKRKKKAPRKDKERNSTLLNTSTLAKHDSFKINLDSSQFLMTSSFLARPQTTKEQMKVRERETRGSQLTFSLFPATTRHQQRIRAARQAGKYSGRKESGKKASTPISKSKSHAQLHASGSMKRISLVMPPNNQNFFPGYISAPGGRKLKDDQDKAFSYIDGGFSVEEGGWEMDSKIVEEEESDCGTARFRKAEVQKTPVKSASFYERRKRSEDDIRERELLQQVDVPFTHNMLHRGERQSRNQNERGAQTQERAEGQHQIVGSISQRHHLGRTSHAFSHSQLISHCASSVSLMNQSLNQMDQIHLFPLELRQRSPDKKHQRHLTPTGLKKITTPEPFSLSKRSHTILQSVERVNSRLKLEKARDKKRDGSFSQNRVFQARKMPNFSAPKVVYKSERILTRFCQFHFETEQRSQRRKSQELRKRFKEKKKQIEERRNMIARNKSLAVIRFDNPRRSSFHTQQPSMGGEMIDDRREACEQKEEVEEGKGRGVEEEEKERVVFY